MNRAKIIVAIFAVLVSAWASWHGYYFFFDLSEPEVVVGGICQNGYYSGDAYCVVTGKDEYRIGDISLFLDGKPLVTNVRIGRRSFEYSLPIATRMIPNGKHTLKVLVRDASLRKNEAIEEIEFFVDNTPLQAAFVRSDADIKVFQGRTLHLQFQVNKPILYATAKAVAQSYPCVPEAPDSLIYECFLPIRSEEAPNEYPISIEVVDRVGNVVTLDSKFQICLFPFKKQTLALSDDKVRAENEAGQPEGQLEVDVARVSAASSPAKLWQGNFYAPMDIRGFSTDYGTIRTSQQRGKYQHNAVDLLGAPKSVVWAPQDGIVVIKDRYAHSGNTVVLDHGCGVITMYFHLDSFSRINVGDKVRKGNPLGTLGMTGYASGYHLHWEMRINNIPVDPMQWIKLDF